MGQSWLRKFATSCQVRRVARAQRTPCFLMPLLCVPPAPAGGRHRLKEGDFDLDLTYITPRVIAMALPSFGIEGTYRNPAHEVRRAEFWWRAGEGGGSAAGRHAGNQISAAAPARHRATLCVAVCALDVC